MSPERARRYLVLIMVGVNAGACKRQVDAAAASKQDVRALVVRHATLFDTRTANTLGDRAIVMRGDRIERVMPDSELGDVGEARVIDAGGRLVVPGFVDVHHHASYVFPDSITPGGGAVSKLVMNPDSIAAYRVRWASTYLPYGVTTVREVGGDDRYADLARAWSQPSADAPDFIASGGAIVSHEDGRVPYTDHAVVKDSAGAAALVRRYHAAGLRDIKLYWRLREPEYVGALTEAQRLGMHVTTHVDFGVMPMRRALALGVKHFEHAYTLGTAVMSGDEVQRAWARTRAELGAELPAAFYWGVLEHFNILGNDDSRVAALIAEVARSGATVTPTLHIFAQHVGVAPFTTKSLGVFDRSDAWTPAQRERARRGYDVLAGYVRRMFEAGIPLAVGTDWVEPGRVALSEMVVLNRAGIPMRHVLAMATRGGARVLERESDYGAVEPGRKAHLVMFERSPLDDPMAIMGGKSVIKDGVVVRD